MLHGSAADKTAAAVAALTPESGIGLLSPHGRSCQLLLQRRLLRRRCADADRLRDSASRHSRHGECPEVDRPGGHYSDGDRGRRAALQRGGALEQFLAARAARRGLRAAAREAGTSPAGRWCSAACLSLPGRPMPSKRRFAIRANSAIRQRIRSRRSSIPAFFASRSSCWCRSPFRVPWA